MAAEVDIYNMALSHVGNATVSGPDDTGMAARVCRLHYGQARDWLLQRINPGWARRRVALMDTGAPPSNWAYSYSYPTDCIQALTLVLPGVRVPRMDIRPPFEVGFDGTKRVIYTDLPTAELVYTARVVDPTLFDAMFLTALTWFLAAEVCMPLSIKPDLANYARNMATQLANAAAASSAAQGWGGPEPEGEFMAGRA